MSKTSAEKLQIKPDSTFWISDERGRGVIGELPPGATDAPGMNRASTAIVFADSAASLRELVARHANDLAKPAALWIAYPKGGRADINRDTLWPILAEHGLRPVTQVALDETWSALRFRPLREGETLPEGLISKQGPN